MKRRQMIDTSAVIILVIGFLTGFLISTQLADDFGITGMSIGSMSSGCTGINYNGSGDWNITSDTYCHDMLSNISKDDHVYVDAKLVLQNVTLLFTMGSDKDSWINISGSGSLYVNDTEGDGSLINSTDALREYFIRAHRGSYVDIRNSTIENCGDAVGIFGIQEWPYGGIVTNGSVYIYNNRFIKSFVGVLFGAYGEGTVSQNTFLFMQRKAVSALDHNESTSTIQVTDNQIRHIGSPSIKISARRGSIDVLRNNITNASTGIAISDCHGAVVSSNIVDGASDNRTSGGITITRGTRNLVSRNNISYLNSTTAACLSVNDGVSNILQHNIVHHCDDYGVAFFNSAENNILQFGNISQGNTYGIAASTTATRNTVRDVIVDADTADIILVPTYGNAVLVVLNTSFETSTVTAGNLSVQWYVDAGVNDSNGNELSGAVVKAFTTQGILEAQATTGSTVRMNISEFNQSSGGREYYNNYSFKAYKDGYNGLLGTDVNISSNKAVYVTMIKSISSDTTSASEWRMFKRDLNRSGTYPGSMSTTYFEQYWNYTTGGQITTSPVIAESKVFFQSKDSNVYALDASDGSQSWNYTLGNPNAGSCAVGDGIVFIGCNDNNFYALNSTDGSHIWNYTVAGSRILSSPVVSDGIVYFGTLEANSIYALDSSTGNLVWNYTADDSFSYGSPAVADDTVYFAPTDSDIYAINATNGSRIWNFNTTSNSDSTPVVFEEYVIAGSRNLTALNRTDGSLIWSFYAPDFVSSPVVFEGTVYIGNDDNNLYALNLSDGVQLWNYTTGAAVKSSAALLDGIAFFGSYDNNTYAVDLDGNHLWNYTTGNQIFSSPAVADGVLFIGSTDNTLYTFKAFPPPAPQQPSGGGGGRSTGYTEKPPIQCTEGWTCTAWSTCSPEGVQTRTCNPDNSCEGRYDNMPKDIMYEPKPAESRSCTLPAEEPEEEPVMEAPAGLANLGVEIETEEEVLTAGALLNYNLMLSNLVPGEAALLDYAIISLATGDVIWTGEETLIPEQANLMLPRESFVPETILPGKYHLEVKVRQGEYESTTTEDFRVTSGLWIYLALLMLLTLITFTFFWFLVGKRKKKKKGGSGSTRSISRMIKDIK
ncbi:PQQ-binding-like beta-propeller repeat protein [Candidatus Woesearchaeota archaeon]|nr:PQQ-binding-like beta-propeller repeat protein [Candidatus Woesearchaeota archaeon]